MNSSAASGPTPPDPSSADSLKKGIDEERLERRRIGLSLTAGLGLLVLGFCIAFNPSASRVMAFGKALIGFSILIGGALLFATVAARVLAIPWGWIYFRRRGDGRPRPPYSIPEGLVKQERYEAAIEKYGELAEEFPEETVPHIEMISIALTHLSDPERAEGFFRAGMVALQSEASRAALTSEYNAMRRWKQEREDAAARIKAAQADLNVNENDD